MLVETSSLTGRVSGFETPDQPDNAWSSTGSIWIKVMLGILLPLGAFMAYLFVLSFKNVRPQPGRAGPASLGSIIGVALGVYGVWSLLFAAVS